MECTLCLVHIRLPPYASEVDNPTVGERIAICVLKSNLPGGNELFSQAGRWFLQWYHMFVRELPRILKLHINNNAGESQPLAPNLCKREYLSSGSYDTILQQFQNEALIYLALEY